MIRIGILGCANIAIRTMLPSLKNHPQYLISGIASRSPKKAQKIASQYECSNYTYDELISDPNIDAIYVPLPNGLHYEWIKRCLQNQKHVLSEKSLGVSLQEVTELSNIALENKRVLMENFQFRFHSQFNEIKKIINTEKIGPLRSLHTTFCFPPFVDGNRNIRYSSMLGGGALLDAGAYTAKISSLLIGKELKVVGATLRYDKSFDVDIGGLALLVSPQGISSHISFGFDSYYQCNIEILGLLGKISTGRIFTAPKDLKPKLIVESQNRVEEINLRGDDQFTNMLTYFANLIITNSYEKEVQGNIIQSKLLAEIRSIAFLSK